MAFPNMKLDKQKVVQRRVDLLEAEGVVFVTNCEIGKDIPAAQIRRKRRRCLLHRRDQAARSAHSGP
jgi:NADPH-dependent glutamate synthase beta subunit-like oxidoreductase